MSANDRRATPLGPTAQGCPIGPPKGLGALSSADAAEPGWVRSDHKELI